MRRYKSGPYRDCIRKRSLKPSPILTSTRLYLYDRYTRPKLLAAAAFIWGATTWLSAVAPTYPAFLATRASTGIDDSSYPGSPSARRCTAPSC